MVAGLLGGPILPEQDPPPPPPGGGGARPEATKKADG